MRKLWMRWAALVLFVIALGALFVRLGEWQLHRLDWRRETNARVQSYEQAPAKPYHEVFRPGQRITDDQQWQRVTVTGTFDTRQVQAMLRSRGQAHGSEALTPMRTTRGEWILVDRGFLVRAQGASEVAVLPAPPAGTVTVTGFVRRNEEGKANAVTPVDGVVRLINSPAIAEVLDLPLLDGYVGLTEVRPAQSGNLLPMEPPELDEGPHLSYALQWFTFTLIAAGGAGVLIRNDVRDRRKAQQRAQRRAERAAAEGGSVGATDAALRVGADDREGTDGPRA